MQHGLKGILWVLCVSAVNFLLAACAKQGYPPGGPEDKTGPIVRSAYPEPGATRVPVNVRPWVLLNEYPQRSAIAGSIFISPSLEGEFEGRVRGKRVEVRFSKPLPANRTVVITFGTGIKDQVGNPMSQPYVLAFSTGDSLDQASLEGDIQAMDNPGATWVWAYPLDSLANPDPRKEKAPYATQPDDKGHFKLAYLPVKSFRVFAVTDTRPDRLWEDQTEAIALPTREVQATVENPPSLQLRLTMQDLVPPRLIGAEAMHRQGIRLSFDEPVAAATARVTAQSKTGQTLSIISAYQNPADSAAMLLATAIQRDGDTYVVRVDSLPDRAGNLGDSLVAEVPASTQTDTVGPKLSQTVPVSGFAEFDPHAPIQVGFTEAVVLTDLPHAVHLADSTGAEVAGTWSYPYPAVSLFTPAAPLAGAMRYKMSVYGDSLRDIFSVVSPDSFASVIFTTWDPDALGSITGKVTGAVPDLRVVADRLEKSGGSWEAPVGPDATYRLENLPRSDYRLWLYQDRDKNQRWSPGRIEPFSFAEPFATVRDSVHVRAGWETEGVDVAWPAP